MSEATLQSVHVSSCRPTVWLNISHIIMSKTEEADLSSCNLAASLFVFLASKTSNRVYTETQRVKYFKGTPVMINWYGHTQDRLTVRHRELISKMGAVLQSRVHYRDL